MKQLIHEFSNYTQNTGRTPFEMVTQLKLNYYSMSGKQSISSYHVHVYEEIITYVHSIIIFNTVSQFSQYSLKIKKNIKFINSIKLIEKYFKC